MDDNVTVDSGDRKLRSRVWEDRLYPLLSNPQLDALLSAPYPVWLLTPQEVIAGANLAAFWLWGALEIGKPIDPRTLLDHSVFNIFTNNIHRLPTVDNHEFFLKKSAVAKRLSGGLSSPLYQRFIDMMQGDQELRKLYGRVRPLPDDSWLSDREWHYKINVISPETNSRDQLLNFSVTTYHLPSELGFLSVYTPESDTAAILKQVHDRAIGLYGSDMYVQQRGSYQPPVILQQLDADTEQTDPVEELLVDSGLLQSPEVATMLGTDIASPAAEARMPAPEGYAGSDLSPIGLDFRNLGSVNVDDLSGNTIAVAMLVHSHKNALSELKIRNKEFSKLSEQSIILQERMKEQRISFVLLVLGQIQTGFGINLITDSAIGGWFILVCGLALTGGAFYFSYFSKKD